MPASSSSSSQPRGSRLGNLLRRFTGLDINGRKREHERRRERRRQRAERHRQREQRHMQRYVHPHGHVSNAQTVRRRIQEAQASGTKVAHEVIYQLAALEGILITKPPSGRSSLRPGMLARLGKSGNRYYFLGYDGYYYYSSHELAFGADFDITTDTFVPLAIRMVGYPYRQLCRS
ncbi:hypothetical protein Daesc_010287 [Daldinia eschscholtzii]|uniref:Uncharacterized protein n=1 Tax=Daldinia eschscholtzii TaxID=292717 RepID=A0AAX6M793_9PEZI